MGPSPLPNSRVVGGGGVHRRFWPQWIVESPGGVGLLFTKPQQFRCTGRQDDGWSVGASLGILYNQSPTPFFAERAADTQGAFFVH